MASVIFIDKEKDKEFFSNLDIEKLITEFGKKNSNINTKLFYTDRGYEIFEYFMSQFPGVASSLLKKNTFIPIIYHYIELTSNPDLTNDEILTGMVSDINAYLFTDSFPFEF